MILDTIEWTAVSGPCRSPLYLEGEHRGLHVEMFYPSKVKGKDRSFAERDIWVWSFFDAASPEPDLAVDQEYVSGFLKAEADLIEAIDGYLLHDQQRRNDAAL